MFVPKKDGKLPFSIYYRTLNYVTVKYSYPIPKIDDCIDSVGQAKSFSTLDDYYGYWQTPNKPEFRHKAAFTCYAGTYRCIRMPFWLTNASATLQSSLNLILSKYNWKTCLMYLDDFIVYSNSIEEQIYQLDEILSTLKTEGVTLYIPKYTFLRETV